MYYGNRGLERLDHMAQKSWSRDLNTGGLISLYTSHVGYVLGTKYTEKGLKGSDLRIIEKRGRLHRGGDGLAGS